MGFKEILDLRVSAGTVVLSWFNSYSGIMIRSPGATIIFDPRGISLEEHIQVDAIVVTHEHSDHFDPELVVELQKRTNALVLTTPFVAQRLSREKAKALKVGDSFVIKDVELHAERCDHPANQPLSFVVSTESGVTIYHPSDSDPFPEMAELRERYEPSVLLYWGTPFKNAAQIAKLVEPQIALSYYTDVESERRFIREMSQEVPDIEVKVLKRFEIYRYPDGYARQSYM